MITLYEKSVELAWKEKSSNIKNNLHHLQKLTYLVSDLLSDNDNIRPNCNKGSCIDSIIDHITIAPKILILYYSRKNRK